MTKQMVVGALGVNTYFVIDEDTNMGIVIDPGAEADNILKKIKENNWDIKMILLTHGHFDHIGGAKELSKSLGCEIIAHKNSKNYLMDSSLNLSSLFGSTKIEFEADKYIGIDDTEIENIIKTLPKSLQFKSFDAPGHTTDSVVFYFEQLKEAFVGDVIFKESVGRTDLEGGSHEVLMDSIKTKVFSLPEDTILYPGHGPSTTVGYEKANNPHTNMDFWG